MISYNKFYRTKYSLEFAFVVKRCHTLRDLHGFGCHGARVATTTKHRAEVTLKRFAVNLLQTYNVRLVACDRIRPTSHRRVSLLQPQCAANTSPHSHNALIVSQRNPVGVDLVPTNDFVEQQLFPVVVRECEGRTVAVAEVPALTCVGIDLSQHIVGEHSETERIQNC